MPRVLCWSHAGLREHLNPVNFSLIWFSSLHVTTNGFLETYAMSAECHRERGVNCLSGHSTGDCIWGTLINREGRGKILIYERIAHYLLHSENLRLQ